MITLFRTCSASMLLFAVSHFVSAQTPSNNDASQIVRVSFVEGDVRVSRGRAAEKATHAEWEQAGVDLPLEAGFSLVTGSGRAAIEFEDASVVYLAENSVLEFNQLSATGGVPHTELALLSGTMTLNVQLASPLETFQVRTPTDGFAIRYGQPAYVRVDSYLDAMTLTSIAPAIFHVYRTAAVPMNNGGSATFRAGQRIFPEKSIDPQQFAEWDQWVAQRVTEHVQATTEAMKQAGLSGPIPGLAEMKDQGTFYACAPYGTCWEPKSGFTGQAGQPPEVKAQTVSVSTLQQGGGKQVVAPQGKQQTTPLATAYDYFPCSPWWELMRYWRDPTSGRLTTVGTGPYLANPYPYRWAVCHSGSWIQDRGHYVWVAGRRRHHPLHWVKAGKIVGYVPVHPRDIAGRAPLNLKNGILHPIDKHGSEVDKIVYDEGKPVTLLAEAPKSFLKEGWLPLGRAETPHPQAHQLQDAMLRSNGADVKHGMSELRAGGTAAGTPITFDHKSQSFMVAGHETQGGGSNRMEPIGGRGSSLQAGSEIARSSAGASGGVSRTNSVSSAGGGNNGSGGGSALHTYAPNAYSGGASNASRAPASSASAPAAPAAGGSGAPAAPSGGSAGKH